VRWLALNPPPQQQQQQQGVPGLLIAAASSSSSSSSSGGGSAGASGSSTLQMNLSPYSWQGLAAARHQHELNPDAAGWHMHLDAAHMGVGGDDSWSPTVHDEYLLPPGRYELGVVLRAVEGGCQPEGPGLFLAAQQLQAAAAPAAAAAAGSVI
jgi:beta-galactosidase